MSDTLADTLEKLKALRAKATQGIWNVSPVHGHNVDIVCSGPDIIAEVSPDDAALIVAAINALPAMLECVEALKDTAVQRTMDEMGASEFVLADWEGGFSTVVMNARKALASLSRTTHGDGDPGES